MPMSKVAVLVVEDVPQVRATAVGLMEGLGCTVFDAYNGHQGLKLLQVSGCETSLARAIT
jgi:CheY-like chemotaxis protein